MVNYNPKVWVDLIFHPYSKQVLRTLLPALGFMGVFTTLVCYIQFNYWKSAPASTTVHSLLGIVLGLFLVFRTNTAYDRWWEGRRLWGGLVNSSRNLAMKLNAALAPAALAERKWFTLMIGNFVIATREQVRNGVDVTMLNFPEEALRQEAEKVKHVPNLIAAKLYSKAEELYAKQALTMHQMINLDKELKEFVDILGACERIRKTPIPYSYTMYIKKFIFIYIITLPFGLAPTLGYLTVPMVLLVSFVLLSVELIAEEIEDPFGKDINDLPTDELSTTIRTNVAEILKQEPTL